MGLLALLDEESKFPRANDLTLAMKFHRNFNSSHDYTEPKDSGTRFMIHHYAGQVIQRQQYNFANKLYFVLSIIRLDLSIFYIGM